MFEDMSIFSLDMPSGKRWHTQALEVRILDKGKLYDGDYIIHIWNPKTEEVMELTADSNPHTIVGLKPYINYRIWVSDDDIASYPKMVFLMKVGGRYIPPPGCYVPESMEPPETKTIDLNIGKAIITFVVRDETLKPMKDVTIMLENYYSGEEYMVGTTNTSGILRAMVPWGRYRVIMEGEGVFWDTGRVIRVRKARESPVVFYFGRY